MANVYIRTKTTAVFRDKTRRLGIIWFIAALMVFFLMLAWVNLPKASAVGADNFVTTWNSGADRIVKIPIYNNATTATQYNFTVDWGDGTTENFVGNSVIL